MHSITSLKMADLVTSKDAQQPASNAKTAWRSGFLSTGASENIKFSNLKQKYKEQGSDQSELPLLFLCQWGGNSLAPNESRGSVSGTLAIRTFVLPWRDEIRNHTRLPEKGNFSRRPIGMWKFLEGGARLHNPARLELFFCALLNKSVQLPFFQGI